MVKKIIWLYIMIVLSLALIGAVGLLIAYTIHLLQTSFWIGLASVMLLSAFAGVIILYVIDDA